MPRVSCSDLTHDATAIFACARQLNFTTRLPGSKYACSACEAPGCPGALRFCGGAQPLRIGFVGDSLIDELEVLARCVVTDRVGWSTVRFALHTVPHREPLEHLLREVLAQTDAKSGHCLAQTDAVVFSFGTWYNWNPLETSASPASSTQATDDFAACVKSTHAPKEASTCRAWDCLRNPRTNEERLATAWRRRQCAHNLDRRAFASDMLRFAQTLGTLLTQGQWRARRVIWIDPAVQHYDAPGGMFPVARARTWPSVSRQACRPIKNATLAGARGSVADDALRGLPSVTRISTRSHELQLHRQHPLNECTHFCLHSNIGWHKLQHVLDALHVDARVGRRT